ncbi:Diguanylate cyclase [Tepidanaerobacter acetatoxydans Re1]|uniref:Diguanylate cyclase n=1 Tax=Tepidanaerobacter acetatoxydans (strain DSM 21804 / JCM 16047 / Re1) TaxID=1209989 RepID=F4LUH3_TEPAE|nr:diguanylate cyclase [Tepidanaerobacter acetatoxydans]AEE92618.1 diguanylate cyclase [Tepidanaerobacter acetatoxydans Re1]CCP27586.1 Diguanylate cyclase [Tepidanaerobacter acetatoxydans Re1]
MNGKSKKIKIYFVLLILEFFVLISMFFLNPDMISHKNYILLSSGFFLALWSFSTNLVMGLFAALFLVFAYGSYILYEAIFGGIFSFTFLKDYFWLMVFPVIAYTSSRLGECVNKSFKVVKELKKNVQILVRVDNLTGLGNKQKFYEDLCEEIRRAKRHGFTLSFMIVRIMFFKELTDIYGKSKTDDVVSLMVKNIEDTLRTEDKKYRLEDDTFAFILPNTDKKGAEVIKSRIRTNLSSITLNSGKKEEKLNFNFKIGIMPYDGKTDDVFEIRHRLEKELEYDV